MASNTDDAGSELRKLPDEHSAQPVGGNLTEGGKFPPESSLAATSLPEYVQRYLNGESVQVLAAEHKVAPRTIYRWMMSELGDQYHDAVTTVLVDRIADADEELRSATNICQITRAREMAKFARTDFERRRPHLYGQRAQTQVNVAGNQVKVEIVEYAPQQLPASTQESESD